jgi:hypothetical protein
VLLAVLESCKCAENRLRNQRCASHMEK